MTTERETTVIVRSWLQEGASRMPERSLDQVLAELPRVRQRRRRWSVLLPWSGSSRPIALLAAIVVLVLVLGSIAFAAGWLRPPAFVDARPFPTDAVPLEDARYVIDGPFPVRISLDAPEGWHAAEMTPTWTELVDDPNATTASLAFATVDAIDANPCDPELGLTGRIGPTGADLVAALTARQGLSVSTPTNLSIGGYASTMLTMTPPSSLVGCAPSADWRIWALTDGPTIAADQTARLWIVDLPATRLVVLTRVRSDAERDVVARLDAIVNSLAIGQNAARVTVQTAAPSQAGTDPPWPKITVGRPMTAGAYYGLFSGFGYDADGRTTRLRSVGAAALWVPDGWYGTTNGIASDHAKTPAGELSWWSLANLYADPCRWRTSSRPVAREEDASVEHVARAVTDAWAPARSPVVPDDGRPRVLRSLPVTRFGYSYRIDVQVPSEATPASCDEGQYRLWVDPDGRTRTAVPGETVRLWVADLGGVLIVVDARLSPGAPEAVASALDEAAGDSLALFYPAPAP